MSPQASARPSSRFGSSPGRRRQSSCSYNRTSGGSSEHLERGPRALRGGCGQGDRRRPGTGGEPAPPAPRRARQRRGRRGHGRAAPRCRLGCGHSDARARGAAARARLPRAHGRLAACGGQRRRRRGRTGAMTTRIKGMTRLTLQEAPIVCHSCVWWQSKTGRRANKDRWIERIETEFGPWGSLYYLVDRTSPWVLQSLFLAAIGEARDKGAKALETFAYRYPEGESLYERFQVHKTIFPRDFLSDFGFRTVRISGPVELVRLEFGGLIPVAEGKRAKVLRLVREAFSPAPVPQRP